MFASDDTIVAQATPEGPGGIGVVRVSGPAAVGIVARIVSRRREFEPRRATRTTVCLEEPGGAADQVVVTWFPSHESYTGEDVVEISAHGSPVVLRTIIDRVIQAGGRLARPGEFTLRAFLGGKLDLVQAEAVADLVNAVTPLQARVACDQLKGTLSDRIAELDRALLDLVGRLEASLDFPDEGFHFIATDALVDALDGVRQKIDTLLLQADRGRMIREGATVVIVGRTNVGKSSLFNALIGQDRAIVTEVAGTTRDLISERVDIQGLALTLVDTAGRRQATDAVEREGVARARRAQSDADLTVLVLDSSADLDGEDRQLLDETADSPRLLVASKSDLVTRWHIPEAVVASTKTGAGIETLRRGMVRAVAGGESLRDSAAITNLRHVSLLRDVATVLQRARAAVVDDRVPEEFVLVELHEARRMLKEIVGPATSEEVLDHIFKNFCIGK